MLCIQQCSLEHNLGISRWCNIYLDAFAHKDACKKAVTNSCRYIKAVKVWWDLFC